jgi:hypothetical protein
MFSYILTLSDDRARELSTSSREPEDESLIEIDIVLMTEYSYHF